MAYQEISDIRDRVLPRFLRGPFVVSPWACFESGVKSVQRTLRADLNLKDAPVPQDEDSFPRWARRNFQNVLSLPLDLDRARYDRLVDLYVVRNALAHTNGLREGMTDDEWDRLRQTLSRCGVGLGLHDVMLVLPQKYVERAYDDVNQCLRDLVTRARAHVRSGAAIATQPSPS
jgi:hypothetical protein